MEMWPKLKAVRFAQLTAGDLFIFPFKEGSGFALKAIDPDAGGDTFILPLGPKFSSDDYQPRLSMETGATTVSFGKEFIFEFSEKADAWSTDEPDNQFYCAAAVESSIYLRVNGHAYPGRYQTCWVKLDDGVMKWGRLSGIVAYTVRWKILLPQEGAPPRLVVEQSGRPFGSDLNRDSATP